jgi:2-polyprenyl-3-methyl-5-hydroxy-6-metoxy-1,4-benzoquinol methylase
MTKAAPPALSIHKDGWRSIAPAPTPEALKAFYSGAYFQDSHGTYAQAYSDVELKHRGLLADLMLHALREARGPGGTLLEIGCGEGWFLKAAVTAGYEARGLEFSDYGLKRFNPELSACVDFSDAFEALDRLIEAKAQVDVCVMEHVLEHVLDPQALLARLPAILAPGGVVAITVPNDFSAAQLRARALGHIGREFWVAPPQHLNYFNSETLPRLLERMGFAVVGGFASFPIDWFLFHPGSNYVADPAAGKAAHQARMALDLVMAENGMAAFHGLAQALLACGAGRSLTLIARPRR